MCSPVRGFKVVVGGLRFMVCYWGVRIRVKSLVFRVSITTCNRYKSVNFGAVKSPVDLALLNSRSPTILKLTCWVCGTNFERKSAGAHQICERKKTETELGIRSPFFAARIDAGRCGVWGVGCRVWSAGCMV